MAVIQTAGLSKRYGDRWAVDRLDLQVEQGGLYGLLLYTSCAGEGVSAVG